MPTRDGLPDRPELERAPGRGAAVPRAATAQIAGVMTPDPAIGFAPELGRAGRKRMT
jgi:hypothetical protein